MKCTKCKKEINLKFSEKENIHFLYCDICKIGGKGKDEKTAINDFNKNYEKTKEETKTNNELVAFKDKNDFLTWTDNNINYYLDKSATFIDKAATKRIVEKNFRYILNLSGKNWNKIWSTDEGRESIQSGLLEANYYAATLGEMGDLVPFGNTCEYIANIECFNFALTSGKNPPFKNIKIDAIYENDQFEISRKNGNFNFEISKMSFPRGEIIGIVVQATETETDIIIGEAFDEKRLMEKAEKHSTSYKYYLNDMQALAEAKTSGENYIVKWEKKLYEKDINNPYVGPDKPEMLKKIAGKSFFRPWMKVRNARAFESEWKDENVNHDEKNIEKVIDNILDDALEQVKIDEDKIKDAEFKTEENGKGSKLFDE